MQAGRYEAWSDPADTWTVWDVTLDAPATLRRLPLVGLEEELAKSLCFRLNRDAASGVASRPCRAGAIS